APRAGQQQQPDGVGGLLVGMLAQRLGEPHQLVAAEISPPVIFLVTLDPLDRIRLAHAPALRQAEHLRQQRNSPVRLIRTTGFRDLAVERVDVLEADIRDLGVLAEMRLDVQPQRALVVVAGGWALAWEMLSPKALNQVTGGWGLTFSLDVAEGITAVLDLAA